VQEFAMNFNRSTHLSAAFRLGRFTLFLAVAAVLLGSVFAGPAQGQDNIGLFWDGSYTQNATTTSTTGFPHILTGYVVLKDPSTSAGISGWEACAEVDGPGLFLSWTLEGQASNFSSEPCFQVGISGPPLPSQGDVLLATCQIMVTEYLPVTLSVTPDSKASLPGEMSYIPADEPDSPRPMTTINGQAEVALINQYLFDLEVVPATLHFDNTYIGSTVVKTVTVTNHGSEPGYLDIFMAGDCDLYSLPGLSGPVTVPVGGSRVIEVAYTAEDQHAVYCNLSLSPDLAEVPMVGSGQIAFEIAPSHVYFGSVGYLQTETRTVTITNLGSASFFIDPTIPASCPDFFIASGGGPTEVLPNSESYIDVSFRPESAGTQTCQIDLSEFMPPVLLQGSGLDPAYGWEISPAILDFGSVIVGDSRELLVTITNTGDLPLPVVPAVEEYCPAFSAISGNFQINPGTSGTVIVGFAPGYQGTWSCTLDLGSILPDVPLTGVATPAIISWDMSPTNLAFGNTEPGTTKELVITILNTGNRSLSIVPDVPDFCNGFTTLSGPFDLSPGATAEVIVEFAPLEEISYNCILDMGGPLPDVPMSGVGFIPILAWESPTAHDFGLVGVGLTAPFTFNVTNTGDIGFQVAPILPDTAQSFQMVPRATTFLGAGQSLEINVDFHPVVPGLHSITLDLGSTVPPVQLQGEGDPRPAENYVSPNPIDFNWVFVGSHYDVVFHIFNPGGTFLDVDISLEDPGLGYAIPIDAEGPHTLIPGSQYDVVVFFDPQTDGVFETTLNLGPQFTPVVVTGAAEFQNNVCTIQPPALVFDAVEIGGSRILPFTVTNNSNQVLALRPHLFDQAFTFFGSNQNLDPGQTANYSVEFKPPLIPGSYSATLTLGDEACADVFLSGYVELDPSPGQNLVGIFFDQSYSVTETVTSSPNEIVEGYLVLVEPSETSGVSAWELAVDIDGDAIWLGWNLEGQHINVGDYNEFIVGIGGSPLPNSPQVLLATFQLLVARTYPNIVNLELSPIRFPSLPGSMVWAPGHDATMLMPMLPFTGGSVVAGINWSFPSGVENPTPVATTRLLPNVPNPFNPMTEIWFEMEKPQQARVVIYDVTGRLVKVLAEGHMEAGSHTRIWQGRDSGGRQVPSGVYYVRMVAGETVDHQKIMLLK
jgi:hypothetical protein